MSEKSTVRWCLLVTANALAWCVLCLQQRVDANPRPLTPGGPTAVQQRAEMIAILKEIRTDLRNLWQYRKNEALPVTDPSQP